MSDHVWSIDLTILGTPAPSGSKKAIPTAKGWRVKDTNEKAKKAWAGRIADVVGERWLDRPRLDGAIVVEFTFLRTRPANHYGTGRNRGVLKDSAPAFPTTRPDGLKLARTVEDALTGVLWTDDARVARHYLGKDYADREGVRIRVRLHEFQTQRDLVLAGVAKAATPVQTFPPEQLSLVA
jgi:Holliday junction resolvase RusA-like endonuclease